jgi:hypothetical protein
MTFTQDTAKKLKKVPREEQARSILKYILQRETCDKSKEDMKALFEFADILKLINDVNRSATVTEDDGMNQEEFIENMIVEIKDRL